MSIQQRKRIGILTSGGDAPGMNPALRAVVRSAIDKGADVFAIYEGYKGMVAGGEGIRQMTWDSVGGILSRGGTVIGTARSPEFRERAGRLQAAQNLLGWGIDRLVVIGGDGSLTGANLFREEWPSLLAELVEQERISQEMADAHPYLYIVGLVGSIDNDMHGTDMTIGTDTALHRITEAVDAISSTASSHQRSFVVEVMGRACGYLALMSALATGADWVFIPESPPDVENWEETMCNVLQTGRATGRRDSIVIVAEGACDRYGNHIDSHYVKKVLEERLGEDTRVTILGHVQRGGSPTAYDRNMSTLCGYAAVEEILEADAGREPSLIGVKDNRVTRTPLMYCVEQTRAIARAIAERNFEKAMELRGKSFQTSFATLRTLVRAMPHEPPPEQRRLRIAVLNAGGLAPGMNIASRVAIRMGIDRGHTMLGVKNSFQGLIEGDIEEMGWMSVSGWSASAGSELGTNRKIPSGSDFYAIARTLERFNISALLIIGGSSGYQAAHRLYQERGNFPAFSIPLLCLPATINNNLPGAELSIGADTALNNIVEVVDKIKQAAVASHRCFVVEVMGRYCGYLAVMSGLATGAERVYTHEEGVGLRDLQADLDRLVDGFEQGRRLGLLIRNEMTHHLYSIGFMCALFEEEGKDLFEVRQAILGHLQQGGTPSPFDRIQATRLATKGINFLIDEASNRRVAPSAGFMGRKDGQVQVFPMEDFPRMFNFEFDRPKEQWWMQIRDIARIMSKVAPH